ncbi:asparagine synthase-related protein [Thiohalocapsa halophila]|nr:asparagine synthase-related protein [Thiohalocapsa halophila]
MPSAERVAQRWRAVGSRCLSELDGDFGVWVYDRRRDLAYAALSLSMTRPLYMAQQRELIVLASEMRQVAAGAGIAQRLDLERVVEGLLAGGPVLALDRTEYVGIDRLLAPDLYRFALQGPSVAVEGAYWSPPAEQRFSADQAAELPAALLDVLSVCVDTLPRSTAFSLSSGYDSGALWAVAHRAGSTRADFRAYTLFHGGSASDEREVVRRLMSQTGTSAKFIDAARVKASAYAEAHSRQVDRLPQVATLHTMDLIGEAARADGMSCHATGFGVEAWLHASATYAADLLRRGNLAALLVDALRYRAYGARPAGRLSSALRFLRTAAAPPGSLLHRLRHRGRGAPYWLEPRWHDLSAAIDARLDRLYSYEGFGRGQKWLNLRLYAIGVGVERVEQLGERYGLELSTPFMHRRVTEFGFRVPARLLTGGRHPKDLLRRCAALALGAPPPWSLYKLVDQAYAADPDLPRGLGDASSWHLLQQEVVRPEVLRQLLDAAGADSKTERLRKSLAFSERSLRLYGL